MAHNALKYSIEPPNHFEATHKVGTLYALLFQKSPQTRYKGANISLPPLRRGRSHNVRFTITQKIPDFLLHLTFWYPLDFIYPKSS